MDSDQVFDHRKFDSGALQGGSAPTDTPSKSVYFQRVAEDLKLDTRDPFTHIFAKTCALLDQRNDLLRELAAARAEADELARRVAEGVWYWHASTVHPVPTKDIEESIARVRAEMEKEKGNG